MISVAMTTYNGEKYIQEQLDSILFQDEIDFELIVCDDNSSDSTFDILIEYAKKDSRIRIFKNELNLGYVKNFEKTVSLCRGDYIALCDQDDIWFKNHLSLLKNEIISKNVSLVGANALLVDSNNNDLGTLLINNKNFSVDKKYLEIMLLYKNIFQGAALMFKKELLNKALPFPEKLKFHDWWLALIASESKGVSYLNVPILRYRQHGNNASGSHKKDTFKQKIINFFTSDLIEKEVRIESILIEFFKFSRKQEKILEVLNFASNCKKSNFMAIKYFTKNYDEIFYKESKFKFLIRLNKMIFNMIFSRVN